MDAPPSPGRDDLAKIFAPLGPAEERRAIQAATAHLDRRRLHIYGAQLRAEKPRRGLPRREITVLLADLEGYLPYEVVVDSYGGVVDAFERPNLTPPYSANEWIDAVAIARRHPEIVDLADRWGVDPAPFHPVAEDHGEGRHRRRRRVGVHFFDATDPASIVPLASVVVDLTAGEVESVRRHDRSA